MKAFRKWSDDLRREFLSRISVLGLVLGGLATALGPLNASASELGGQSGLLIIFPLISSTTLLGNDKVYDRQKADGVIQQAYDGTGPALEKYGRAYGLGPEIVAGEIVRLDREGELDLERPEIFVAKIAEALRLASQF